MNCYYKPYRIVCLIRNSALLYGQSYYPETKRKSLIVILYEQILQILLYGKENMFYFPYGFDVKSASEMKTYIHYYPFMQLRDSYNDVGKKDPSYILRNKLMFSFYIDSMGFRSCNNIALIDVSRCYDMRLKKEVDPLFLFESLSGNFFLKPLDGECGDGILKFEAKNGSIILNNKQITARTLLDIISSTKYLLQGAIVQHQALSDLHPSSINTIRLITVRSSSTGKIEVFPSILRVGTGGAIVDNTSQGGLAIGVNKDGLLLRYGYYKPEFGLKVAKHPDTNIEFDQYRIPYYQEATNQAKYLHSMLPGIGSIGWDIAISDEGPLFIEGNDNWEINGPQICHGGLKDTLVNLFA